jgi:hypothetical protein
MVTHGAGVTRRNLRDTLARMRRGSRFVSRLSRDPAQRAVQVYIVAFMGVALVSVLALAVPALREVLSDPSGQNGPHAVGHVALRLPFGIAAALVSLRLPWVTWQHRGSITRVLGVRGTYVAAAAVTIVVPVPWILFWTEAGLGASAVGLVSLVIALAVRRVPRAQRAAPVDVLGLPYPRGERTDGP